MSYPYGQPGYGGNPQQPYGQPEYPGYGGNPPRGYYQPGAPQPGYPPRKPGGGTAITAGILALLQGIAVLAFSVFGAFATRSDRHDGMPVTGDYIALILVGTLACLYLAGAILLLSRRAIGRILVVALPGIVMVVSLGAVVYDLVVNSSDVEGNAGFMAAMLGFCFALELPTMCLALTRSTGRWIDARTAAAHIPQALY